MRSSLLQLKLKLGNAQSPNAVGLPPGYWQTAAFRPVCNLQSFAFRCLVWPPAAINHQWPEQERILIEPVFQALLVFQVLLVFQELPVSQVILEHTTGPASAH